MIATRNLSSFIRRVTFPLDHPRVLRDVSQLSRFRAFSKFSNIQNLSNLREKITLRSNLVAQSIEIKSPSVVNDWAEPRIVPRVLLRSERRCLRQRESAVSLDRRYCLKQRLLLSGRSTFASVCISSFASYSKLSKAPHASRARAQRSYNYNVL